MKCEICKKKISETFLEKPMGTYVYDKKHKMRLVCFECQSRYNNDKEKILEAL